MKTVIWAPLPFPPNYGFELGAFPTGAPTALIGDEVLWRSDIFPKYSLASRYLINEDFGLANSFYASAEIFDFYAPKRELRSRTGGGVPRGVATVKTSWTRIGPWVPWMCISEAETGGNLAYHARAETLSSVAELPQWVRDLMSAEYPLYLTADQTQPDGSLFDSTPNDTSWTAFHDTVLEPAGLTWEQWCAAG